MDENKQCYKTISENECIFSSGIIISAGSLYLDIDAYACCVAMRELLCMKGEKAIAFSEANCNYSVCKSLISEGQVFQSLPPDFRDSKYIIVDVSDPDFLADTIPLESVYSIYDHHVGFEEYWRRRIGDNSHIEFIGAAATLIYREWKKAGLQDKISRNTARLLIAAIVDNTLYLTSSNTTQEDRITFDELCDKANVNDRWCVAYFSEVQESIEADLRNALFYDIKSMQATSILPSKIAQLCIWNSERIFNRLSEIRTWFGKSTETWMINIIDIQKKCSFFICDDKSIQSNLESIFGITFFDGVAKLQTTLLRKEIIKIVKEVETSTNNR